ncbi:BspA family leucine-rich repeat surface protein [Aquimarina sp. AU58]|uniref:BspA family leucine-rich repeat surface protein n=1 Tax=Aquimarina sp. AU58 TaxID=1874112 RepID=UPI000D6EAFC7|nr:BspA family leucine-rich repeat surface protein [Aquimarina sp. AU58]
MKIYLTKGIILLMVLVTFSCSNDDEQPQTPPVVNKAPEINAQTFTTAEDIADDAVIGKVAATDPENKALTFTLTKNSDALFELTDTGELSLVAGKKLDFETTTSYTLSVEVSDGTHKASADITVTVENVSEPFITTWKTTTANEVIAIDLNKDITYDYTIDWGDGTVEKNQTTAPSHTYVTAGTYTVSISGTFPMFIISTDSRKTLETIEQWGDNQWESLYGTFAGAVNMTYNAKDVPNLSKVTSIAGLFANCAKFNAGLNDWDVSTITDMRSVFDNATSFNGDLSQWDVSKVTNMKEMFANSIKFNGDLSNWDVSSVTDMASMFYKALSFSGDISQWDVSKITDMTGLFYGATAFNGDLSKWDVSNVIRMRSVFIGATAFNGDISQWDVSNVTDMGSMFSGATSFNGDLSKWNVSKVTNMRSMFWKATSFSADISDWDIQNVTVMEGMLDNTNISTVNYDALLTKWAALPNVQSNVGLGVEGLTYCTAQVARENLTGSKRWSIIGDTSCPR